VQEWHQVDDIDGQIRALEIRRVELISEIRRCCDTYDRRKFVSETAQGHLRLNNEPLRRTRDSPISDVMIGDVQQPVHHIMSSRIQPSHHGQPDTATCLRGNRDFISQPRYSGSTSMEFAKNGQCEDGQDRPVSRSEDILQRLHEQLRQGQPIRLEDFEKLRNEVEENHSRSSFNESLCDDRSFDFSRGAVSPISDDDNKSSQHLSSQIMSTEQSPGYQSEMEDSQYFFSQEYNDRDNHFKSEKRRDEVRPTDRMEQTVATRKIQSKAKDSSRHDSDEHWETETGMQSEAEVQRKSVETRDSQKSDWEINMEERLHRLRRNLQTTTATRNEAADRPIAISSTYSDSLERIPESPDSLDQAAEDDVLYSSQRCKHNPGYQCLSDNHADESNEDFISYSCSDHRVQQHTLCGRRRKVEYVTNSMEVSEKQRNQGVPQRNAKLDEVNDSDEGILVQQRG